MKNDVNSLVVSDSDLKVGWALPTLLELGIRIGSKWFGCFRWRFFKVESFMVIFGKFKVDKLPDGL
jgi:hypothetical protein